MRSAAQSCPAITEGPLIAIGSATVGQETVETVNARELHDFLGVGKDFSTWIKDRIETFGFVAGQDFVTVSGLIAPISGTSNGRGGARPRPVIDYHLTLGMAKELAMVERTDAGKRARLYFIECERQAKAAARAPAPAVDLNDPTTLRGLLLSSTERRIVAEEKVAEQAPAVAMFE